MALIPPGGISILKPASEVKQVADNAIADAEEMAVAKLINTAANTGEYTVLYNNALLESTISTLESQGYTVTQRSEKLTAEPKFQYIISWKS